MVLTSLCVLFLATAGFVFHDWQTYRHSLVSNLTALSDVIGANSTAALTFEDHYSAEELLHSLQATPQVVAAAFYTKEATPFSQYIRTNAQWPFPSKPTQWGAHFESGHLIIVRQLLEKDTPVGLLYVVSDLNELDARLRQNLFIGVIVLLLSVPIAIGLAELFQRSISRPVLTLAQVAQRVSKEKNYSLRAPKETEDEIGALADAFNDMLMRIHERDTALQHQTQTIINEVGVLVTSVESIANATATLTTGTAQTASAISQTSHRRRAPKHPNGQPNCPTCVQTLTNRITHGKRRGHSHTRHPNRHEPHSHTNGLHCPTSDPLG